ncbi:serine hydrolase domain-containing protein [Propionimicrobium sp. PCR01-08-3]|uniref:serine hydrolase domain-containing protein n=1 Tax=Propionimicrobium sp. PCR01-08-3 TaxID=3052086 RepID=UPI00255CB15A|nr:serine hydrolase domain-containing protein [Propionimicrobium sp. PCR01-08-3]WIY82687.1 serine hydrolase domain-containing protein [Propionimicrobium sp. PCR01-08-3]
MTIETDTIRPTQQLKVHRPVSSPANPIVLVSGPELEWASGDPDQPFWVASIDKVFIATLIAQLFDDLACGPETPIGDLLPTSEIAPFQAAPGVDNARDITVQHLLSHTSGLSDIIIPPRGHHTECSMDQLIAHPQRIWTLRELLHQGEGLPAFSAPGERFRYCDTAYLLLMRIIEEARGTGFSEQIRSRIFEPCKMADTSAWVDAPPERLARLTSNLAPFRLGRSRRDTRREFAPNLTWSTGMGGPATAHDLVRFQRKLHAGELCDPRWVDLFGTPLNRLRPGIYYGTGMVSLRFKEFSPLLRDSPRPIGGLGYTATHMFYYPDEDTHVIINFYSHRAMASSFRTHIRLAGLIKQHR